MCGILGSLPAAGLQLDCLAHRGPDGRGTVVLPEVAFGHTRLAILDLSDRAAQPKWSRDGRVLLTYNGEIYNFRTLGTGEEHSDTVALAEWLAREGPDFDAARLDGMYAFAAWFPAERRLVLSRDPAGIKPLYVAVAEDGGALAFSSEIKGFFGVEWFRPRPTTDEAVQRQFLQDGCSRPQPVEVPLLGRRAVLSLVPTLMAGVYQLCPGQTLTVSADAEPRERWTHLEPRGCDAFEALDATVVEQSVSDVEVGIQLSGGIDSSLVAYHYAQRHAAVHGFFVSVDWGRLSEAPWAEIARDRLSKITRFQFHRIPVTEAEVRRVLPAVMWYADEPPIRYPNAVGLYLLCEYARRQTKVEVLLSGEGADEIFGGYPWQDGLTTTGYQAARRMFDVGADPFSTERGPYRPRGGYGDPPRSTAPFWRRWLKRPDPAVLAWQLECDRTTFLPPILLRQDRMSMAHGIETRVPFLANRFLQMPPPRVPGKRVLKRRAAVHFGRKFAWRRKVGFSFPFAWMGGSTGIRPERLQWLRGTWHPKDPWQEWTLACLSAWSEYYLYGGWKDMVDVPPG